MTKSLRGRGGRPVKQNEEKRCIQINIRVTIAENDYYAQQAAKAGISISEYLRRAGLNMIIAVPRPIADAHLIREINAIGVNINQIARSSNRGQDEREFWRALAEKVANTMDELVQKNG